LLIISLPSLFATFHYHRRGEVVKMRESGRQKVSDRSALSTLMERWMRNESITSQVVHEVDGIKKRRKISRGFFL
jgi:hypothetical protein